MSGQLVHEMLQQNLDLISALAEGGHVNGECAQPVIKIFAKFVLRRGTLDIDIA